MGVCQYIAVRTICRDPPLIGEAERVRAAMVDGLSPAQVADASIERKDPTP